MLSKIVIFLFLAAFLLLVEAQKCPKGCKDLLPPMGPKQMKFTCASQKEFGQCGADFMEGYCMCTCGTCEDMLEDVMMLTSPKTE